MSILRQIKALHPKPELKLQIIDALRREGEQGVTELGNRLGYQNKSSLYRYLDDLNRGGVVKKTRSNGCSKWVYRLEDFYITITPETTEQYFTKESDETNQSPELNAIKQLLYTEYDINVLDASGQQIPFSPAVLMKDFLDAGVDMEEAWNITLHMKQTAYNDITAQEMREKIHRLLKKRGCRVAAERYRRYIIDPIKVSINDKIVDWEEKDLKKELKNQRKQNKVLTVSNREMNRLTVNAMKNLKKLEIEPIPLEFIQEYLMLLLRNIQI